VYRLEVEKATLVQEVQRIGSSSHHAAIQQVASQSVVSSANADVVASASDPSSSGDNEYRCVFNSCSVGMAVATMGGSFIDCNPAFTQLSKFTKQELQAMTIFNITSRDDLQGAFDMMSQLITPSPGGLDADGNTVEEGKAQAPVVLRSGFRHRNDLGLSVSLIRGDDGVARNFNVTLVKLPPSPLGGLMPVPATADTSPIMNVVPQQQQQQQQVSSMIPLQQMSQQGQVDNKQNYLGLHAPQFTAG
jgi:PAS domain-containing protein